MTDAEYQELLEALAKKHFRPARHTHWELREAELLIERLSSIARLNQAVSERPDSEELRHVLAEEIRNAPTAFAVRIMESMGVVDALEEAPKLVFENLRRSAIPAEDLALMREAGIRDPEAEITIIIHYSRRHVGRPATRPRDVLETAQAHLDRAAGNLDEPPDSQAARRKGKWKVFNGIGKILAGAVTGAGNTLLGVGTIAAPNPATAYGVIASAALAIGGICQGIGDLRGE